MERPTVAQPLAHASLALGAWVFMTSVGEPGSIGSDLADTVGVGLCHGPSQRCGRPPRACGAPRWSDQADRETGWRGTVHSRTCLKVVDNAEAEGEGAKREGFDAAAEKC